MSDRAPPHAWRWEDDVVALYLFRAGTSEKTLAEVDRRLGITPEAMRMRIANFKALAGGGGLENASRQSRAVFDKHKGTPDAELRQMAVRILREGTGGTTGEQEAKPAAAKPEKLPPLVHVVCGLPLALVVVGGAIGGALGGTAYALALMFYRKTRSLPQTLGVSVVLGAAAAVAWYLIVSAMRS